MTDACHYETDNQQNKKHITMPWKAVIDQARDRQRESTLSTHSIMSKYKNSNGRKPVLKAHH
jgi:hypothetical protein